MKLIHVIVYMVVLWVAAAFSPTSDFALGLCYALGILGVAAIMVSLVRYLIDRFKR